MRLDQFSPFDPPFHAGKMPPIALARPQPDCKKGHVIRSLTTIVLWVVVTALLSFEASARDEAELARPARVSAEGANDPQERLRDELGEFMVYFERTLSRLKTTAIRAAGGNTDELEIIRGSVVLIELKFTEAYAQPDPFVALIELWYDAYRLNAWRWKYEKRDLQLIQANGISQILNRIREIARRWIQPAEFGVLDEKIRAKASSDEESEAFVNPERMRVSSTPTLVSESRSTGLMSVLGIPFAPFAAAGNISRTAAEVGIEARRVADRIDRLPADLGHQAEIITLQVLSSPQVESALSDLNKLSADFARISDEVAKIEGMMDQLPVRIRKETTILLESISDQSAELVAISESMTQSFESAGQTLDRLALASAALNDLTLQVEATSLALDEVFGFSTNSGADNAANTNQMLEVRKTADSIAATSQALQDLIASPDLERAIDRLDRSIQGTTAQADLTLSRAIDQMTRRLALLLVMAFLLGVAWVLVFGWQKKRLLAHQARQPSPPAQSESP